LQSSDWSLICSYAARDVAAQFAECQKPAKN
jgi:hypothetical protein